MNCEIWLGGECKKEWLMEKKMESFLSFLGPSWNKGLPNVEQNRPVFWECPLGITLLLIRDAPYTSQVLLPCDLNTYA